MKVKKISSPVETEKEPKGAERGQAHLNRKETTVFFCSLRIKESEGMTSPELILLTLNLNDRAWNSNNRWQGRSRIFLDGLLHLIL